MRQRPRLRRGLTFLRRAMPPPLLRTNTQEMETETEWVVQRRRQPWLMNEQNTKRHSKTNTVTDEARGGGSEPENHTSRFG